MITVILSAEALGRVRLTFSPTWEAICSMRRLVDPSENHLHTPWVKWVRPRIDAELMEFVTGLVPESFDIPDFLTPPPGERPRSFEAELATIAATDPAVAKEEFEQCFDGRPPATIRALFHDPTTAMPRLAEVIHQYWKRALLPIWPRLRRVVKADLAYRADELAGAGLHHLLNHLHPRVSFDGENLMLRSRHHVTRAADTNGLVLVPCVFAWPDVVVVASKPYPVTISYAPRGAGTLWETDSDKRSHPAAKLIGRSRATILALLDFPLTTSQLAEQTEMSQPAVSQHLAVLRMCGLVESRRNGRMVFNTRSELGHALLDATFDH